MSRQNQGRFPAQPAMPVQFPFPVVFLPGEMIPVGFRHTPADPLGSVNNGKPGKDPPNPGPERGLKLGPRKNPEGGLPQTGQLAGTGLVMVGILPRSRQDDGPRPLPADPLRKVGLGGNTHRHSERSPRRDPAALRRTSGQEQPENRQKGKPAPQSLKRRATLRRITPRPREMKGPPPLPPPRSLR